MGRVGRKRGEEQRERKDVLPRNPGAQNHPEDDSQILRAKESRYNPRHEAEETTSAESIDHGEGGSDCRARKVSSRHLGARPQTKTHSGPTLPANGQIANVLTANPAMHNTSELREPKSASAPSPNVTRPNAEARLKPARRKDD